MARVEDLIGKAAHWSEVATKADNIDAVATKAAATGLCHYVTHLVISTSAAPTTAVSATITDSTDISDRFELPAAAFAPIVINYVRPLRCAVSTAVVATLPAIGASKTATITMKGFTAQP